MKRQSLIYSPFAPFILLSDLTAKAIEMMWASAQVIAHRTSRMAMAGHSPNARDRREFALMGREKLEAGANSAQGMAAHLLTTGQSWGAMAYRDWLRTCAALASFANSRTPGQVIARQAALTDALWQSALGMANIATSTTRLAHRGLKPVHAKAVANAKRLAKRRPKGRTR